MGALLHQQLSKQGRNMSTDYQTISYQLQGNAALITLSRPKQMNAWTSQMAKEIKHAIEQAENDTEVVGIVITGEGKAFCAGADMADLMALSGQAQATKREGPNLEADPGDPDMPDVYRKTFSYIASVRKPVIAAVNGAVAGMALPFILFCDMRFFSKSGFVMSAFPQRGLVAEYGTSWILPRIVGLDKAFDIIYSSRKIYGEEAKELGLATKLFEDDELVKESINYVQMLADKCAPESLRQIKNQVYRDIFREPAEALDESERLMLKSFSGDDMKEGVAAFMEKRTPNFKRIGKS
jgi:enoyl-CoA hydratase/carnithine racemase